MLKVLEILEVNTTQIIKALSSKTVEPTVLLYNGDKWRAFPLKSGMRSFHSPLLRFLAMAIRQDKDVKEGIGREEVKLALLSDMSLYLFIESIIDSTRKILDLISTRRLWEKKNQY